MSQFFIQRTQVFPEGHQVFIGRIRVVMSEHQILPNLKRIIKISSRRLRARFKNPGANQTFVLIFNASFSFKKVIK